MKSGIGFLPLSVFTFVLSFLSAVLAGHIFIPQLKKLKIRQTVREEGLASHYVKTGTPTMGGIIFLFPLTLICLGLSLLGYNLFPYLFVTLSCGMIGFYDDWEKVAKKNSKGISARTKMMLLACVSAVFILWCNKLGNDYRIIVLPFLGKLSPVMFPAAAAAGLGIFIILAFTNGVNLTDGVDGLAGSVAGVALLFFYIIFSLKEQWQDARLFCICLLGAVLGYLIYNVHPAKVFMGDTGSLALGGALSAVAVATGLPLVFVILGGVFAWEDLTVMIQVFWYKRTKKRFFKMAPFHHHLELCGWKENGIVAVFIAAAAILGVIACFSLIGGI